MIIFITVMSSVLKTWLRSAKYFLQVFSALPCWVLEQGSSMNSVAQAEVCTSAVMGWLTGRWSRRATIVVGCGREPGALWNCRKALWPDLRG